MTCPNGAPQRDLWQKQLVDRPLFNPIFATQHFKIQFEALHRLYPVLHPKVLLVHHFLHKVSLPRHHNLGLSKGVQILQWGPTPTRFWGLHPALKPKFHSIQLRKEEGDIGS